MSETETKTDAEVEDQEELPPRPEEILDDTTYQRMRDLSDDEYRRLARDIRNNGVLQSVTVDEDGQIIDGHNRVAIATHYGLEYATDIRDGLSEAEKSALAVKLNVSGREVGPGEKREAVKRHIKETWPRDEDGKIYKRYEPQAAVAEKTGVSRKTVSRALEDLGNSGHLSEILQARRLVREYYEEDPDASYREIAREVDLDHKTVANWIKQDFGDEEDGDSDEDDPEAKPDPEPEPEEPQEPAGKADDDQEQPPATDGENETETENDEAAAPEAATGSDSGRSTRRRSAGSSAGGNTRTATTGAGIDPNRGALDGYSTEDILGGPDADDETDEDGGRSSRRRRPISFTNETVRQQLVEHGTVITARHSTEPTGRRPWNTGFGEPEEGVVLVAEIAEVDLADTYTLEEFVHRSGYETVEEWQAAIGAENGRPGYLYLAIGDDLEDGPEP